MQYALTSVRHGEVLPKPDLIKQVQSLLEPQSYCASMVEQMIA
jgi:hypothetical protein